MSADVTRDSPTWQPPTEDAEETVLEAIRDLARWLYRQLRTEHDHLTSDEVIEEALLHKSGDRRISPVPGQTHPTASVTGMPRAVKPFRTATRTWNSDT